MGKRLRQHVNPLKMTSLLPREPLELPAEGSVDVELGCADARFLIELAVKDPGRLYIGLDIREEFLDEGREAIDQRNLQGIVRLEACNLLVDIGQLFAAERVERFFINFPDPWFKRRQRARRWFDEAALDAIVNALQPGGQILFQSDVWELCLDALALLSAEPRLRNVAGDWRFTRTNPFGVRSTRERICERQGRPIWRVLFTK